LNLYRVDYKEPDTIGFLLIVAPTPGRAKDVYLTAMFYEDPPERVDIRAERISEFVDGYPEGPLPADHPLYEQLEKQRYLLMTVAGFPELNCFDEAVASI
jgi:hypothetical protein